MSQGENKETCLRRITKYLHVGLVIGTNFLDTDIIFGINEGLRSGIGFSEGDHTGNVLKIILVLHFHLQEDTKGFPNLWKPNSAAINHS